MSTRVKRKDLQTVIKRHGITLKELRERTGMSRQQGWNLWHGRVGVGKATAKRLHERLAPLRGADAGRSRAGRQTA